MNANVGIVDGEPLVGVKDIVSKHWAKYGRHFYCRYDYEGKQQATQTGKQLNFY
jgi:phosphoglucomutase